MALSSSDFDLWLSLSETPLHHGLFFVGPLDTRITFYSQVRALRLVHALVECGRVSQHEPVAVIGAGAAGITAALAAAVSGCDVTLYERGTDILPLQSGSPRLLHPHIYEWPFRGSLRSDAVLPFLDWSSATGNEVRTLLKANYEVAKAPGVSLSEKIRWTLDTIAKTNDEWLLTFRDQDGEMHQKTYGTVLLSLGFGDERTCGAAPSLDYWRHPGFGPNTVELDEKAYFVSGFGDGGLTDALAIMIRDFEHLEFTRRFLARVRGSELADAVAAAEAEVPNFSGDLMAAFEKHVLPVLETRSLIDHVAGQLRKDRRLVLNADPLLAKGRASRLNQVMAFSLLHAAAAEPERFRLVPGEVTDVITASNKYLVEGPLDNGGPLVAAFDGLVLRHGPNRTARFTAAGSIFSDYRSHHEALLVANPELRDPPRLAPETFDRFDQLFTDCRPDPGEREARRAVARARRKTLVLSWDPAYHSLVQQGRLLLEDIARQIDTLPLHELVVAATQAQSHEYIDVLQRLARASDGRLTLVTEEQREVRNPYPAEPLLPPETLWLALEQSLVRLLDARLVVVVEDGVCPQLGPIHPTIGATLMPTWVSWCQQIEAQPEIRTDFLRFLFKVEPAGQDRWNGDHACLPNLTSALVLMLATHIGETLVPASCAPGNVRFGTGGLGLGSGCDAIDSCPVEDFQDARAWSVDALILSQARSDMFRTADLITEAGETSSLLTRARRVAPVVIPNTRTWRTRLGQDLTQWQAAIRAEFESWRKRQQNALEDL